MLKLPIPIVTSCGLILPKVPIAMFICRCPSLTAIGKGRRPNPLAVATALARVEAATANDRIGSKYHDNALFQYRPASLFHA